MKFMKFMNILTYFVMFFFNYQFVFQSCTILLLKFYKIILILIGNIKFAISPISFELNYLLEIIQNTAKTN